MSTNIAGACLPVPAVNMGGASSLDGEMFAASREMSEGC